MIIDSAGVRRADAPTRWPSAGWVIIGGNEKWLATDHGEAKELLRELMEQDPETTWHMLPVGADTDL